MTKLEIVYDIKEKLKIQSDDEVLTDEYFSHLIDVKRNVLIKQTFSNLSKPIPISLLTEVCLPLELVDSVQGMPLAGTVLRTKFAIPKVVNITGREDLITISSRDVFSVKFNLVQIERFPYLGNNKYLNNQIYTALNTDGKIYFYSGNEEYRFLTSVTGRGVFESPSLANKLSCNATCDELDNEYPIEGYMIDDIVNLIRKDLLVTLQTPKDETNDARDDREEK